MTSPRFDSSFPERAVDPPDLPSHRREQDDMEEYAALFEQDVLAAAQLLGWEMVNRIVDRAKEG